MNCQTTDNYLYNTSCHSVKGPEGKKRIIGHLEYFKTILDFEKYSTEFYIMSVSEHLNLCKSLLDQIEKGFEVLIPTRWRFDESE